MLLREVEGRADIVRGFRGFRAACVTFFPVVGEMCGFTCCAPVFMSVCCVPPHCCE